VFERCVPSFRHIGGHDAVSSRHLQGDIAPDTALSHNAVLSAISLH
jgi:hypothetical protein